MLMPAVLWGRAAEGAAVERVVWRIGYKILQVEMLQWHQVQLYQLQGQGNKIFNNKRL